MDYVNILSQMIEIDTSVPPGNNYSRMMAYLEPFFKNAGFDVQNVSIPPEHAEGLNGRVALIAHRRSPGKPRLIFYGHADVVPAAGWAAFTPTLKNGRLYGRGSADMKGAIVALLGAIETLKDTPLKYDVSVAITVDEEVNQASQLRYISHFLEPLKGATVFCLDSNFGYVSVAALGLLQMEVRVKGKSVHSGLSHMGTNAIENAVPLMNALLDLKKKVTARRSKVATHPETGLKVMEPRLNINMINGGLKVNIVPDSCTIAIDRRLIPEESDIEAEKELMAAISSVKGVEWDATIVHRMPSVPPCNSPSVGELERVIKEVTGQTGRFGEMGSGDLFHIVYNDWKAELMGIGSSRTDSNIHAIDEFVRMDDIRDLDEIIRRFVS
jgi:succinyl-diaminopimelate desuccinylase